MEHQNPVRQHNIQATFPNLSLSLQQSSSSTYTSINIYYNLSSTILLYSKFINNYNPWDRRVVQLFNEAPDVTANLRNNY